MELAQEAAIVSYTKGEFAYLKTQGSSACGNCSSKSSCSSFSLFNFTPKANLKVPNTLDLKEGDQVIVGMAPEKLIVGTVLIYILPLLSLFVFAAIGKTIAGEGASIIAGLGGFVVSLLFVRNLVSQQNVSKGFEPKLLKKVIQVKTTH